MRLCLVTSGEVRRRPTNTPRPVGVLPRCDKTDKRKKGCE